MSTCTALSSPAEIMLAYQTNADYRNSGSVTQARNFATAIRLMLAHPQRSQFGGVSGESATWDTQTLRQLAKEADEWANAQSSAVNGTNQVLPAFQCLRK